MTRRSISATHVKPKTYAKRIKSIGRSVTKKMRRNSNPLKATLAYKSLFPVK